MDFEEDQPITITRRGNRKLGILPIRCVDPDEKKEQDSAKDDMDKTPKMHDCELKMENLEEEDIEEQIPQRKNRRFKLFFKKSKKFSHEVKCNLI